MMVYRIDAKKCVKCALCVSQCPEQAFEVVKTEKKPDGLMLYTTAINQAKCTGCDACFSHEWWCPAKAIVKT
jgi:formate hydrogenlyase subunit 6/NADH:ubiquinone oxidoreductase subunit I